MRFFNILKGDKIIWMIVIFLSVFSVLAVYSSTGTLAYRYQAGNTSYYLLKHFLILVFGFALMYVAHLIKYTYYSRISQIALFLAIPLLIFTLFSGTNINEAPRWLTLPIINLTFQSSDFAKLALIMYVARLLSNNQDQIQDLPIMLPIIAICFLILPANLSTSLILFTTVLVLLFIGRVNLKYVFSLVGLGLAALVIFLTILYNSPKQGRFGTWKNRIESFVNSDNEDGNYQTEQSKIAIATGGIIGKFPGNSTQRNFIPHPYSDFIFAIIIEEYGLIGGIVIVLLYLMLLFRSFRIVTKSPGTFSAFLTFGLSFSLVFQAMINMGVAVNIFPVTGQPLPLISMGGTSIWFTSLAIGIILSVSKEIEPAQNTEADEIPKNPVANSGGVYAE
jgi:cell division protein FtsW